MSGCNLIKQKIGEIVLISQIIESNLSLILLFLENKETPNMELGDIESSHKKLNKETLGQLKNRLINVDLKNFDKNNIAVLYNCTSERNFIHNLSKVHADDFLTSSGRKNIVTRINVATDTMKKGKVFINNLLQQIVVLCGVNPKEI